MLGIGRGPAYAAIRRGELPSVRLGRRILVPRHRLLSLLNADEPSDDGLVGTKPEATRPDAS